MNGVIFEEMQGSKVMLRKYEKKHIKYEDIYV